MNGRMSDMPEKGSGGEPVEMPRNSFATGSRVPGLVDEMRGIPVSGFALARELTSRTDGIIRKIFDSGEFATGGGWSIVALGSYGRRELCPFSDIDILFLLEKKTSSHQVESNLKEILYPMWDAGLTISYSVRSLKEALHDARGDFFLHTSLLDARHICGSERIFRTFIVTLAADRYLNDVGRFVSALAFHTRKRHERFDDTTCFHEPHVKEGRGCLRDLQSIAWLEKILKAGRCGLVSLIGRTECRELSRTAGFMLKTRFILHEITGRKTDRIHLEHQDELAREMGYVSHGDESAVEVFLRDFHLKAAAVHTALDALLRYLNRPRSLTLFPARTKHDGPFIIHSGLLSFSRPEELKGRPLLVMSAFLKMAREGLNLTPQARAQIKDLVPYDTSLRVSSAGCTELLRLLQIPGLEHALISLLDTGVLEQLVPEFSAIRGRTIFDAYHSRTVDMHSIHTVCALHDLIAEERAAFALVSDPEALYFSALFHDIGKGSARPHTESGAEIVGSIAGRFGFDRDRSELAAFLIRNHLVMPDIALRRDLCEEKVIDGLARLAATPQRLSMLYLLTIADSRATGPEAWSEWKASLVRELYVRTLGVLENGIFRDPENAMRLDEKWRRLIKAAEGDGRISGRLWALPQEYILKNDVRDVRRHLALSSALAGNGDLHVDAARRRDHIIVTFIARDCPGLFSILAGLLAVNRLEIVSARIFTWYDGTVADTFTVTPPWPDWWEWNGIVRQFADVIEGKLDLEDRIRKITPLLTGPGLDSTSSGEAVSLAVDNEGSDFFTIIDVQARRRAGLVYDISRAITSSGLDIHRAFLTRKSDLLSGVFYVTDANGEKLRERSLRHVVLQPIGRMIGMP